MNFRDQKQIVWPSISQRNMPAAPHANFGHLQERLIRHLQRRIRSGEITERSLARMTGISQPHLHNFLKGKRLLSFEKADRILFRLQLDLRYLLEHPDEPGE
jgi:hypothetical protein